MPNRRPVYWASRIGAILAVAGSAIGLGSFLRFPNQAALHGGGTFMVPYLCALVLLGLPLMWMEWSLGRLGGIWGRHSLPGIFDAATHRPWAKYLGVAGIYLPFVILVYYTYVQSWTLGYGLLSATGTFRGVAGQGGAGELFNTYSGIGEGALAWSPLALLFLALTLGLNFYVSYRGPSSGVARFNQIAMPILFVLAIALVVYVLMLPKAVMFGLNYLWHAEFDQLFTTAQLGPWRLPLPEARVWLAAAGQVLFSLSLGLGVMVTFGSYLRKDDDIGLSALTTTSLNSVAEVILGASIAIPAAVVFFTVSGAVAAAQSGAFALGFQTAPLLFQQVPYGNIAGAVWFILLFFAGITAASSLLQPLIAFFQDEMGWTRRKATLVLLAATAAYLVPVVLLLHHGFLDQMDFWGGTFLLVVGALIELLVFIKVLGMKAGWEGITHGSKIRIPRFFKFVLQYVAPTYLIVLLACWFWQRAVPELTLESVPPERQPFTIAARVVMGVVLLGMLLLLRHIGQRRRQAPEPAFTLPEEVGDVS
ncbi:MAG: sodium-dependent transporter [Armatimonadota bacterium]